MPFTQRILSGPVDAYMASTNGVVSTGTVDATVTSIAYLWHPSADASRFEISRIDVSFGGGAGGAFSVRLARITAEDGTPGGTSQTINPTETGDTASGATFRTGATGAPTRATGDYAAFSVGGADSGHYVLFDASLFGKPLVLRASEAEGYEVRTVIEETLTTASNVAVTFYWTEF